MTIPLVLSAISLCFCISGFFFFRRYIDKKTSARELLADYREETYRLIAEIDAAADRDSLLVEERIKTLKKLLDDTDRRISVYTRELQRSRNGEAMYSSLGKGIRAALDTHSPQLDLIPAPETPIKNEENVSHEMPAPKEARPRKKTPAAKAAARKPNLQKTKIKTQIAELSAKGLSPPKIASRLHLSLAEVDLALNLLHHS